MIIVSNTSPIINLAAVGRLDILRLIYSTIRIPQAVYDEIVIGGAGMPGSDEVRASAWIQRQAITDTTLQTALLNELDRGEAEAVVLALEAHANLLLIDERRGRIVARRLGVDVVGLLGVLVVAKNHQFVQAVRPLLDDLMQIAGFHISQALYQQVLQTVGE